MKYFLWQSSEPIAFLIYVGAFFFYARKIDGGLHYWIITITYLFATILLTRASIRVEGDTSNNFYYNLLYPITSAGISYYFFTLLLARWKKIVAIISCLTTVAYYFSHLDQEYFDSIGHVIASTGIVLLIFLYLQQLVSYVTETPLSLNFDFWFVCVQLMYQLGSFAIFLSYNYFTQQYLVASDGKREISVMLGDLWIVHNIILFVGAIVTAYAVVRVSKKFNTR
ncbi:MAG: hypothetical protein JNM78_17370 [Cyclobacteriaceae bacterium]|nr:hypothetical protein [Cyclobacteriaceae bacterium]